MVMTKIGRNAKCVCGSTKKFKRCCAPRYNAARAAEIQNKYLMRLALKMEETGR
jgi:uncharacterized protein YecA (UPF0149 family)